MRKMASPVKQCNPVQNRANMLRPFANFRPLPRGVASLQQAILANKARGESFHPNRPVILPSSPTVRRFSFAATRQGNSCMKKIAQCCRFRSWYPGRGREPRRICEADRIATGGRPNRHPGRHRDSGRHLHQIRDRRQDRGTSSSTASSRCPWSTRPITARSRARSVPTATRSMRW